MQIRELILGAALAVTALLAGACGETSTPAPTPPPAAEANPSGAADATQVAAATLPEVRYYKISDG